MRNAPSVSSLAVPPLLRFGRFELNADERVLRADGEPVALGARAFDVLAALVARAGTLVSKDELLATVWSGLVVEENNLQVQVSTLRKILGHGALTTVPGRGYRFDLAVAAGDAALPAGAQVSPSSTLADATDGAQARTNLPSRLPWLYGRADDVGAIAELLRERPVVTITGAGGIGKTRVAQAVARQLATQRAEDYPDGVWWVELAPLADATLVSSAVAQAMGVRLAQDRPCEAALRALLAERRALLVLDNCEHLADAVAALVDRITAGAPRMSVLVTSQETLKAADEHVYRLGSLEVPADADSASAASAGAVELFEARARAVDPHFKLDASNVGVVIEICRRLDGIPLAIELAAARLPLLGVEGLRARLHERFNLLTGGARVVLRRHQTLRATLEWSHGLLTPDEQTVLRRLSVFAGGFTLEAAQHVSSDERIDRWTALDQLGALVDKSLVLAEGGSIPRYRMLETTRVYGLERLHEAGETQMALRRHAEAILALLEPLDRDEWGWRATGEWLPAARVEVDNVRAALEWADSTPEATALAVALAGVSYSVWWSSFHMAEGLTRCIALRRRVDETLPAHLAARFWLTLTKLGLYSLRRESYEAAVRAAALYRELGDEQRCFDALTFAAVQGARFATIAETEVHIAHAAAIERPQWPARQRACLQFARCWWLARQERREEALAAAALQVRICREGGAEVASLYAVSNVTSMEVLLDRPHEALAHTNLAIARLHELSNDGGAGHLYANQMLALVWLDRLDDALEAARNAYARLLQEGDEYRLLSPLALLHALRGRLDTALHLTAFEDAATSRLGENASSLSSAIRQRLEPLLAAVPDVERAKYAAEGAAMRDEQAFGLAFASDG